jgi:hypothetical protein
MQPPINGKIRIANNRIDLMRISLFLFHLNLLARTGHAER